MIQNTELLRSLHARATSRWNNPIHTQVLDHLAVVVPAMPNDEGIHCQPRLRRPSGSFHLYWVDESLRRNCGECTMTYRERAAEVFHDVLFAFHRIGTVLVGRILRRLFSQHGRKRAVVVERYMFHLLPKRTHSLERAIGWREVVLLLRHRLSNIDQIFLH